MNHLHPSNVISFTEISFGTRQYACTYPYMPEIFFGMYQRTSVNYGMHLSMEVKWFTDNSHMSVYNVIHEIPITIMLTF